MIEQEILKEIQMHTFTWVIYHSFIYGLYRS